MDVGRDRTWGSLEVPKCGARTRSLAPSPLLYHRSTGEEMSFNLLISLWIRNLRRAQVGGSFAPGAIGWGHSLSYIQLVVGMSWNIQKGFTHVLTSQCSFIWAISLHVAIWASS